MSKVISLAVVAVIGLVALGLVLALDHAPGEPGGDAMPRVEQPDPCGADMTVTRAVVSAPGPRADAPANGVAFAPGDHVVCMVFRDCFVQVGRPPGTADQLWIPAKDVSSHWWGCTSRRAAATG